jgi:UDP-2,3-diacylglucosamine pyrophosphatase LpxH
MVKESIKRDIEIVVISDVHLATYGCRAQELLNYLQTVNPQTLILNGDIIDMWQFNKRYFPTSHLKVIKYITSLMVNGTQVHYITGNHDEMLRKFNGFNMGSFQIVNKLVLDLDGDKAWFFHGDVFDVTMRHSKWLAKLGGHGYDILIVLNTMVNWISQKMGHGRLSLSKRIKNTVKQAVSHINDFEKTVVDMAMYKKYEYVVCGHIHQPQSLEVLGPEGRKVTYLNSGDWVEHMTALEYDAGKWNIYEYLKDPVAQSLSGEETEFDITENEKLGNSKEIFNHLVKEFQFDEVKM